MHQISASAGRPGRPGRPQKGAQLKVYIIPEAAKEFNDYLSLVDPMERLLRMARQSDVYARNRYRVDKSGCVVCGRVPALEVHHVKPLWVYALEFLLRYNPKSHLDLVWERVIPRIVVPKIDAWSAAGNLIPLCKRCHRNIGRDTNRQWKAHFDQYNVIFAMRRVPEFWDQGRRFTGYP